MNSIQNNQNYVEQPWMFQCMTDEEDTKFDIEIVQLHVRRQ